MSLFNLLTLRSMRARPTRLLLSTFGIVLGVATILAINVTNRTALESVTRLFQDTSGKANLSVVAGEVYENGFPERVLYRIEGIAGISATAPSIQMRTILADESIPGEFDLDFFGASTGGLVLYGIDPIRDRLVRDYTITRGSFLSGNPDASEVVLVETFAEENDLEVGDSLAIITPVDVVKLKLVGLMAKEGPGQLNNGTFGIISLENAQKYYHRENELDQIDILVDGSFKKAQALESLRAILQERLGADLSVIYPASQGKRMTQMLGSYQIGLNFLSGMALFVGAFLIFNAYSMTVVERTREYGMLRTIGMTRAQVTRQVLGEAVVLGLVASGLGVGLGVLMARSLTRLMETLLNQDMANISLPADILVTSLIIGLVVAVMAALIPAWQAGRISPLEALRIRAGQREGWLLRNGWLLGILLLGISVVILLINPFPYDVQFRMGSMVVFTLFFGGTLVIPASVKIWERALRPAMRLLFGNSGRLGSRNIQRARLRTTLTVAALMIGVAMIIVVWVMTDSFKGDLDTWLKGYIGGDLYVTSSLPMKEVVWKRLQSIEGVAAVTPVRYFEVKWKTPTGDKEKIVFMAVDPASHSQVTSFIYSQPLVNPQQALEQLAAGGSLFISSVLAEKYNLSVGDQITLVTRAGDQPFNIAAVVVDYYNQGLVVDGSWVDMSRYFRQKGASAYLVKTQPGASIETVKQIIDARYGDRYHLIIESNQALLGRVSVLMNQAFSMFDVLALIAMLVGFMGIMNTLTMNVMERIQEIGMLRGVGMTRGQVVSMVLAEAALMGLIGGILGLVFGIILSRVIMLGMTAMSGYQLTYMLPLGRVFLALFIALVISVIAALIPAQRASRVRILEAIHYE